MPTITGEHHRTELKAFDRLVLTGFMGSGKSTVGVAMAGRLGWKFVDLDREIELRAGRSIAQVFALDGEPAFRHLESLTLIPLLARRGMVLALGGGVPELLRNRLLLEQTPRTAIVHLAAPFQILIDRCDRQPEAAQRPLLANLGDARQRFAARIKAYEAIADYHLDTAALTEAETVNAIVEALGIAPVTAE